MHPLALAEAHARYMEACAVFERAIEDVAVGTISLATFDKIRRERRAAVVTLRMAARVWRAMRCAS